MAGFYKKQLDSTFSKYYERFRRLNATSPENAVTKEELFREDLPFLAYDRMHKMLSMGIVKRVGTNRYWLDENKATDGNSVLKNRILVIVAAALIFAILIILDQLGIVTV